MMLGFDTIGQGPIAGAPQSGGGTRHTLGGSDSTQANTSSIAGVGQRHILAGTASSQGNTSTTGAIGGTRHTLAGTASSQSNNDATARARQHHRLSGSPSSQANVSDSGEIVMRPPSFHRSASRTYSVPIENRILRIE